jgi:hypothetical protein
MIQHLEAILIIIGQLALWAFYAMFAVAGVVVAINAVLEVLHKVLKRITGSAQ